MRKGISEVVGMILLLVMVIVSAGSFFYWYSSGQDTAQIQTETQQTDVFNQIYSQTSALVKAAYTSNREVNINNFAEYITQICSDEKKINMAEDEIRLEVYEGYGAGTELICAVRGFPGGCKTNSTTLFGVLGGKSTVNGLYTVKSTDGSTWTTSSVGSDYNSYNKFNFTHLDSFIEGNNATRNPENVLLMGIGNNKNTGKRKSVLAILDRTLKGNSYNITDLDENITAYYTAELAQEIPGGLTNLYRGGAFIDPDTEDTLLAILTKQVAVYDVPEQLISFGSARPIRDAKITSLQRIKRLGVNQLLIGVTGDQDRGGTSFIDETQDLNTGAELNYPTAAKCPYDVDSFAICGVTVNPVACEITIDGVPEILHVPEFTNSSKTNSAPVFIAVNNLTNGSSKVPAVLWTGYIQDTSTIFCVDLVAAGADPSYDIVEMKYQSTSGRVLIFMKNSISPAGTQVLGIRDSDGNYDSVLMSPPTPSVITPETFGLLNDSVYVGGSNGTHATIEKYLFNGTTISSISTVYSDDTYSVVQKLFSYTSCTVREPTCVKGCNQILKKGDCTILNLSIEDSSCDISKYSSGTKFTVKTGIGKYFEKFEIFTKKTGTSTEVNASGVS